MNEERSYNRIRLMIDTQASSICRPLSVDPNVMQVIRDHDLDPVQVNKIISRVNMKRLKKLKRIYNKQAIHLISLQILNATKQELVKKFENLLDLNTLLIPFRVADMSKSHSIHEFKLIDSKDSTIQLLKLVEELPNSNSLMNEIDTASKEEQGLEEILQKYDYLKQELTQAVKEYLVLQKRIAKYKDFNELMRSNLDAKLIQKNIVISSNTKIIEQMNKSRILIEKVTRSGSKSA